MQSLPESAVILLNLLFIWQGRRENDLEKLVKNIPILISVHFSSPFFQQWTWAGDCLSLLLCSERLCSGHKSFRYKLI